MTFLFWIILFLAVGRVISKISESQRGKSKRKPSKPLFSYSSPDQTHTKSPKVDPEAWAKRSNSDKVTSAPLIVGSDKIQPPPELPVLPASPPSPEPAPEPEPPAIDLAVEAPVVEAPAIDPPVVEAPRDPAPQPAPKSPTATTPPPAFHAATTKLDAQSINSLLFDAAPGTDLRAVFESQLQGRSGTWTGVLDRMESYFGDPIFGDSAGTRATVRIDSMVGSTFDRAVTLTAQLETEHARALHGSLRQKVRVSGRIVDFDPLFRTVFVADATLDA